MQTSRFFLKNKPKQINIKITLINATYLW